jgi:GTP-binding protein Era
MNETFRCGRIALVGRPNVGKSSLLNRLVGANLSIASAKPQTTRDNVIGVLTSAHCQYIFVDTPGRQCRGDNLLNRWMSKRATEASRDCDLAVLVIASPHLDPADIDCAATLPAATPVMLAINKIDQLRDKARLLPLIERARQLRDFAAVVPISARRGQGCPELLGVIREYLPIGEAIFAADQLSDRPERFCAAEFLREQLFRQLGDELPYGAAVVIDAFEEEGDLRRIAATVVVDKEQHKAMVVGAGGARLKSISTKARIEMERFFGAKVFLKVWVKARPGWSNSAAMLRDLVYR